MTIGPASHDPSDASALLITGATGKTGGHAARLLLERGHRVRALVHRLDDRSAQLSDSGAEVVVGDLHSLADIRAAAESARAAYSCTRSALGWLRPPPSSLRARTRQASSPWSTCRRSRRDGTPRVSPLRVTGLPSASWTGHRSPSLICSRRSSPSGSPASGGRWIRLECCTCRLPTGDTPPSPQKTKAASSRPSWRARRSRRQDHPLFGAQEMNHYEIAEAISRATGRQVRYEPADIDAWAKDLQSHGYSQYLAQHLSSVAVDYRNGVFSGTNDIVSG